MFDDFKALLSVFNAHKVKYLVVGAYAVGHHAQPRATKDLDVLIQPAPKNSKAVYRALVEFGAPHIATMTAADFADKGSFLRMGVPPVAVHNPLPQRQMLPRYRHLQQYIWRCDLRTWEIANAR